jgi:hypothetical protein
VFSKSYVPRKWRFVWFHWRRNFPLPSLTSWYIFYCI